MRVSITIIATIFLLSFSRLDSHCEKLTNGKYLVKFDTTFGKYDNYYLKIHDKHYIKYFANGDSALGNIEWGDYCDLYFIPDIKINPDTLSYFDKLWYNTCGNPYFEIQNSVDNKTKFISWCNPHVMTSSGILIKQPE